MIYFSRIINRRIRINAATGEHTRVQRLHLFALACFGPQLRGCIRVLVCGSVVLVLAFFLTPLSLYISLCRTR